MKIAFAVLLGSIAGALLLVKLTHMLSASLLKDLDAFDNLEDW